MSTKEWITYFRGIPMDEVFKRIAEGDEKLKIFFLDYISDLRKQNDQLRAVIDTQWFACG